ncbi:MAG: transporter [Opitutus sp.]
MKSLLPIATLVAFALPLAAQTSSEPKVSKEAFTWWNPTPANLLRELSTDRPDKTECPFTVDAGHIQIELDAAVYSRDHDTSDGADSVESTWTFAATNLKVGLTNNSDVQFVFEPLVITKSDDHLVQPAQHERSTAFSDVTVRYKRNFWGNEGGPSTLAIMPFVKLPIHGHGIGSDAAEGGVILPYSHDLPNGWGLGVQTELDVNKNSSGHGYHAAYVNSITAGHPITDKLEGYAELFSEHSAERGARWVGTADFGLTYSPTSDLQLDIGVNIGISPAATDVEFFTGLSRRF